MYWKWINTQPGELPMPEKKREPKALKVIGSNPIMAYKFGTISWHRFCICHHTVIPYNLLGEEQ